jgi:hypothetical protein
MIRKLMIAAAPTAPEEAVEGEAFDAVERRQRLIGLGDVARDVRRGTQRDGDLAGDGTQTGEGVRRGDGERARCLHGCLLAAGYNGSRHGARRQAGVLAGSPTVWASALPAPGR